MKAKDLALMICLIAAFASALECARAPDRAATNSPDTLQFDVTMTVNFSGHRVAVERRHRDFVPLVQLCEEIIRSARLIPLKAYPPPAPQPGSDEVSIELEYGKLRSFVLADSLVVEFSRVLIYLSGPLAKTSTPGGNVTVLLMYHPDVASYPMGPFGAPEERLRELRALLKKMGIE